MKKLALSSLVSLLFLSCSVPVNNSTQEASSSLSGRIAYVPTSHYSLNFSDLEKEYKSFSAKALSDAYVLRMFNKFLLAGSENPVQVVRQLEFARYLKDFKSDSGYFNSLNTIIENDNTIYTKMIAMSYLQSYKTSNPASFGLFIDSLNPNPETIITSGLVLNLDPGNHASYSGSGTTWTDLSGNGNNGTLVNEVAYDSSNGGSLSFDGINDYVTITNGSIFNLGTGNFSFSCYVKTNTFSLDSIYNRRIFSLGSQGNVSNNFQLILDATGKAYMWSVSGHLDKIGTITVANNQWHNIVVTRNGNIFSLYVDGVFDTQQTYSGSLSNNNTEPVIGRYTALNAGRFAGKISPIHFYNRALTISEIQQNFNVLRVRFGL